MPPCAVVDLEPLVAQQDAQGVEDARLVVDDQDRRLLSHAASSAIILAGRKMVNVVPAPGRRIHEHQPAVRLDGALHDREAEPAAARTAGDERVEEPLADLLWDARPVVPDLEPDGVLQVGAVGHLARLHRAATLTGHLDRPAGRLDRVEHQVVDDPVQQVLVARR